MLDYKDNLEQLYNQREWYLKHPDPSPLIETWVVPSSIEIKGSSLAYQLGKYTPVVEPDHATIRREILGGFLQLADADDTAIRDYARRFGVLGLCRHGLPAAHLMKPFNYRVVVMKNACKIKERDGWLIERLERWRHYARQMRSIIALSAELQKAKAMTEQQFRNTLKASFDASRAEREGQPFDPKILEVYVKVIPLNKPDTKRPYFKNKVEVLPEFPGRAEDWQIVLQESDDPGSFMVIDPVITARQRLSGVINQLLGMTAVRPFFSWTLETEFYLRSSLSSYYRGGFLLPILVTQLMLLINGSPDYALCSSCNKPILLRKGQSVSRKSYCKDCGSKAARREAVKKYYKAERTNPERKKRVRLKPKEVQTIQRLLKKSKPGLVKELAKRYGVSEWAIYKIREGKTWKNSE